MTTTLVLPDSIADVLRAIVQLEIETGAVLLARPVTTPDGDLRLLGVRLNQVPAEAYDRRDSDELLITSEGYVPSLAEAEEQAAIPIWLHTHPGSGSSPKPSRRDRRVDNDLSELFRLRSGSDFYGAVIIANEAGDLTFSGHLENDDGQFDIDRLMTVGPRLTLVRNTHADVPVLPPLFDRNIRAFGGDVQHVLHELRVAVVGCGGTGSAVAEQLVRLGVRDFLLVDPDELSASNLTRVYGSDSVDVGRPKVDVLADHLRRIAPDVVVRSRKSMITTEATARDLIDADIVFGCTDDNAGRLVLSRLSTYMILPVIDCGVVLTSDADGTLDGIHGRVTVMYPGAACLACRDRIDIARAASEVLTPEERIRRTDEGYAPALGDIEPAVVAYTTLVAATAVAELLERLTGYGPEPVPSEVLLRIHDREISTNEQSPGERHYCHPDSGQTGRGLTDPFLEQTWSA